MMITAQCIKIDGHIASKVSFSPPTDSAWLLQVWTLNDNHLEYKIIHVHRFLQVGLMSKLRGNFFQPSNLFYLKHSTAVIPSLLWCWEPQLLGASVTGLSSFLNKWKVQSLPYQGATSSPNYITMYTEGLFCCWLVFLSVKTIEKVGVSIKYKPCFRG